MSNQVSLCLVLHNHQPVGNFDGVIEQAYQDSYLPFIDVFEEFDQLAISLHTSGPLLRWLVDKHPEYIDRLRHLVAAGRIEIVGGPYYEPILPMLPSRDRIGQIVSYTGFLKELFSTEVNGMWMPERVWESSLTTDIAAAGMNYTVLDDFHFRAAGLQQDELFGYYATENDGSVLRVFPGSERLRYLLPFAEANATIEYAASVAANHPNAVLVFGDDGEKFGTWPDTKVHVYEQGWLKSFFQELTNNKDWLKTTTLRHAVQSQPAVGKIYLPDCSYREMTEWALPADQQEVYDDLCHELSEHVRWNEISRFMRGGNWRNFKVRYNETNEMYGRMMHVSNKLQAARRSVSEVTPANLEKLRQVEDHLYRGQCNCPYWHGAFGGVYLPHLRNANYAELIAADNKLESIERGDSQWVDATSEDFDFDLNNEVCLANDQFAAFCAPARGGMLYEFDVRSVQHNLLATIQRRPESYHRKVLQGSSAAGEEVASIHDRVVFKQEGLEEKLQYDKFPRKSFLEHFYDNDVSASQIADGSALERGDFVAQPFEAKLRRSASKVQLQQSRDGNAWGIPIKITKALTLEAGSPLVQVAYLLEGLPRDRQLHLALEWNFSGMPAGANDRFFYDAGGNPLGHLGSQLDVRGFQHLGLIDTWQGLDVLIALDRPADIWTFPIETVSQSEAGFEAVHQSVCVMPHWLVQGDDEGKWSVQMQLRIAQGVQPCVNAESFTEAFAMA